MSARDLIFGGILVGIGAGIGITMFSLAVTLLVHGAHWIGLA